MRPEKLIINVALTGIVPRKDQNGNLPVTPSEIAEDARRVYALGASIVHIHARDENGNSTHRKEIYKEIIGRIRDSCGDLIITVSTSGRRTRNVDERMEVLELDGDSKPDMASVTLGSVNFPSESSVNPPEVIEALLSRVEACQIKPELEIFELGMANYAKYLYRKGVLKGKAYANLILGCLGAMPAAPKHLVHVVEELPEDVIWAATGVGQFAFEMQCLAIVMGGHVRVGLEDSLYMDKEKKEPASNERLVARILKVAEALGREVARPKEVRGALGL